MQSIRENYFEFKACYKDNPALKTIMEDKLADTMRYLYFYNSSKNINIDFLWLFHGDVPNFDESSSRRAYTTFQGRYLSDETEGTRGDRDNNAWLVYLCVCFFFFFLKWCVMKPCV